MEINAVIATQSDFVKVMHTLKQIVCMKWVMGNTPTHRQKWGRAPENAARFGKTHWCRVLAFVDYRRSGDFQSEFSRQSS